MQSNAIVSPEQWTVEHRRHLQREKQLTRLRAEISAERRALPWVEVTKRYEFDGPHGRETLAELFGGRSQLIVKHFMLGPDWEEAASAARSMRIISTARICILVSAA